MLPQNSTPPAAVQLKPWARLTAFTHPAEDIILTFNPYYVYFESLPSTIQFSEYHLPNALCEIFIDPQRRFWIEGHASAGTSVGEGKLKRGMSKQLEFGEKLYFYNSHGGTTNIVGYYFYPIIHREKNSSARRTLATISSLQTVDEEKPKEDLMKLDQIAQNEALCPCCFKELNPWGTLSPCNHKFCATCIKDVLGGAQVCPTCKNQVKIGNNNVVLTNSIHKSQYEETGTKRKREPPQTQHVILCENSQVVSSTVRKLSYDEVTQASTQGKRMKRNTVETYIEPPTNLIRMESTGNYTGAREFKWPSGDLYVGDWKDGKRDGNGRFMWANGNVYEGTWKHDRREGKGKLLYVCGNVYEGEFKGDREHGRGKLIWANGDVYEGQFSEGFAEGNGRVIYENGETYEGEWRRNKPNGKGIAKYKNGDSYEGEWKDGHAEGKGKFYWVRGDVYEGEFKNDLRDGEGKLLYVNGNVYEGNFKYNEKSGWGRYTWANGDVYEGWWKFDLRDGNGRMTNGNVLLSSGEWRKDQLKTNKPSFFKRIFRKGKNNKIHEQSASVISY